MDEMWSYDKEKRVDRQGKRWHFVRRHFFDKEVNYDDLPYELYFRNDERTEFGLLRFEKAKDNPYRDYDMVINKIMNNPKFRRSLLNSAAEGIWNKNWK